MPRKRKRHGQPCRPCTTRADLSLSLFHDVGAHAPPDRLSAPGPLAQLVERHVYTVDVVGSIPAGPTVSRRPGSDYGATHRHQRGIRPDRLRPRGLAARRRDRGRHASCVTRPGGRRASVDARCELPQPRRARGCGGGRGLGRCQRRPAPVDAAVPPGAGGVPARCDAHPHDGAALARLRRSGAGLRVGRGLLRLRAGETLTEDSRPGDTFLADLCVRWEAEARRVEDLTRVALLRTAP